MHQSIKYLTLFILLFSITSFAENAINSQQTKSADPVFEFGFILDETFSKPAADFYNIFYINWQPVTESSVSIRIQEQPGFFRASFILVWMGETLIFKQRIPQRYDDIEVLAKRAVKQLNQQLLNNLFMQRQLDLEY